MQVEFMQEARQYLKERDSYFAANSLDPKIKLSNLDCRCTDQISEKYLNSDKALVISHPGWNRLNIEQTLEQQVDIIAKSLESAGRPVEKKKLTRLMPMLFYLQHGEYRALRDELMIEHLIDYYSKQDIPVIITAPCNTDNPSQCDEFTIDENPAKNYISFIKSLIDKKDNVYILPTTKASGAIFSDVVSGIDCMEDSEHAKMLRGSDPAVAPLLNKLIDNNWKTIYLAGGYVHGCMGLTMNYFALKDNPNLVFLVEYCQADDEQFKMPEDGEMAKIIDCLISKNPDKKRAREITKNWSTNKKKKKDIKIISSYFMKVNKMMNPDSNSVITVDETFFG